MTSLDALGTETKETWTILANLSSYQLRIIHLRLNTGFYNETVNFVIKFLITYFFRNNTVSGQQSNSEVTKVALGTNPYSIIVTPEVIALKIF